MGRTVAREDVGAMKVIETPVLIVGGAGCGLSSAIMLAQAGIESWLVERYPTTSPAPKAHYRSEEHTSELQSLMRISYAVFCLTKQKTHTTSILQHTHSTHTTHTRYH